MIEQIDQIDTLEIDEVVPQEKNDDLEFLEDLNIKDSFMFIWKKGMVLPMDHPNYYAGYVNVDIRRKSIGFKGSISFEKDTYQLDEDVFWKLNKFIEKNLKVLINLSLTQECSSDMRTAGGVDSIKIKYKGIYLNISRYDLCSPKQKVVFDKFESKLRSILMKNKVE